MSLGIRVYSPGLDVALYLANKKNSLEVVGATGRSPLQSSKSEVQNFRLCFKST